MRVGRTNGRTVLLIAELVDKVGQPPSYVPKVQIGADRMRGSYIGA